MRSKKALKNAYINILMYFSIAVIVFITKKVMINNLGDDVTGLNSILQNTIDLLKLLEMGITVSIIYSLYEPIKDNNREKIKSIIKLLRNFYFVCGTLLSVLGGITLIFLPKFINSDFSDAFIRGSFLIYLLTAVIYYFVGYKICILHADQNGYIVIIIDGICKIIQNILQIIVLTTIKSYTIFLIVLALSNIIYMIIINIIVNKKYSWLNCKGEDLDIESKNSIIQNVKSVFLHKISAFVISSTGNFVISAKLSLSYVTNYGNYFMITNFCNIIMNQVFNGITASIGNLIVESRENLKKINDIFKNILFLNFCMTSMICIGLVNVINPFINMWVGERFILSNRFLILIILNLYLLGMKLTVEKFKEAAGLYNEDKYMALLEAILNIILSLILVNLLKLDGIIIATILSYLLTSFWVKPLILYKKLMNTNMLSYFCLYFKYFIVFILAMFSTIKLNTYIIIESNILKFLANGISSVIVVILLYLILFIKTKEFNYCLKLVLKIIKR